MPLLSVEPCEVRRQIRFVEQCQTVLTHPIGHSVHDCRNQARVQYDARRARDAHASVERGFARLRAQGVPHHLLQASRRTP